MWKKEAGLTPDIHSIAQFVKIFTVISIRVNNEVEITTPQKKVQ